MISIKAKKNIVEDQIQVKCVNCKFTSTDIWFIGRHCPKCLKGTLYVRKATK